MGRRRLFNHLFLFKCVLTVTPPKIIKSLDLFFVLSLIEFSFILWKKLICIILFRMFGTIWVRNLLEPTAGFFSILHSLPLCHHDLKTLLSPASYYALYFVYSPFSRTIWTSGHNIESDSTVGLSHSTGPFNLYDNVQVHAAHRLEHLRCDYISDISRTKRVVYCQ